MSTSTYVKMVGSFRKSLPIFTSREMARPSSFQTSLETSSGTCAIQELLIAGAYLSRSYPLHPTPTEASAPSESSEPSESAKKRDSILSHENPSNGILILGHTSLLTSFILVDDEKYVISADRDEHVRVSWYPQGHVIESFCLGHQK